LTPKIVRDEQAIPKEVWMSSKTGLGIDLLKEALLELLSGQIIYLTVLLRPEQSKLRATLYQMGAIISETIDDTGQYQLQLRIQREDYLRLFP
jgi:GTPase